MEPCIFCEIAAGRTACSPVWRSPHSLAFMNRRQANPGHLLVIPIEHIPTIDRLPAEQAADLIQVVTLVAAALRVEWAREGLSVFQNNGPAAFQEIPHLHFHLLPRCPGDGLLNLYPELPAQTPRPDLDALAAKIQQACRLIPPQTAAQGSGG